MLRRKAPMKKTIKRATKSPLSFEDSILIQMKGFRKEIDLMRKEFNSFNLNLLELRKTMITTKGLAQKVSNVSKVADYMEEIICDLKLAINQHECYKTWIPKPYEVNSENK